MPESRFLAEYLGVFTDTEDSVFAYEHVMNALASDVQPLFSPSEHPNVSALSADILPLVSERWTR